VFVSKTGFISENFSLISGDGDLNLNARLDLDGRNLTDNIGGGVEINQSLVNSELKTIKGVGSFSARRFSGGDAKDAGGEANGALHLQILLLRSLDQRRANLLEVLDVLGGEGDADAMEVLVSGVDLGGLLGGRWCLRRGRSLCCHLCRH